MTAKELSEHIKNAVQIELVTPPKIELDEGFLDFFNFMIKPQ